MESPETVKATLPPASLNESAVTLGLAAPSVVRNILPLSPVLGFEKRNSKSLEATARAVATQKPKSNGGEYWTSAIVLLLSKEESLALDRRRRLRSRNAERSWRRHPLAPF